MFPVKNWECKPKETYSDDLIKQRIDGGREVMALHLSQSNLTFFFGVPPGVLDSKSTGFPSSSLAADSLVF